MIILSLNCGSSSVKFMLFDYDTQKTMATGLVERVTVGQSFMKYSADGRESAKLEHECPDHKEAIRFILNTIVDPKIGVLKDIHQIAAVGHRAVHGGERFTKSVRITPDVIQTFKDLYDLAPLHNPPNVLGMEAAMHVLPDVPHMAIMDTAWHQTMPQHAYMYAIPSEWYAKYKLRRYGFHGTSFLYVAKRAAVLLGKDPFKCNLVCLHIGNGVSANAIKNGCSYDTSMGLTPLEGLIMGTRAGDHDAALDFYIMEKEGKTPKQMNDILNKKSGILGITGKFTDRRDVEQAAEKGDESARLAIEMEAYRIKKYIGAYTAAIGGADAIVFTAGVGEMSDVIRAKACEGLEYMGVKIDPARNREAHTRNAETEISAPGSKVRVFVIPTDEERVFIEDVVGILKSKYEEHTKFSYPFQKPDYINHQRKTELGRELEKKPGLRGIIALPPQK
ncbi:MAG: propionate kinase [Bdellovibrionales bacterium RIFOXYD1_FULL_53_11]|nr:MAG: propionate kinase [Bdellovibrionales bacterium RIFOXYD1_FULL_53_11]